MKGRNQRKAKLVSVLLILVLLMVNSLSSIMADEIYGTGEAYTIPASDLSGETEIQDETAVPESSISGVLWLDANNDGILDEGEELISDYPVYLYSEGDLTAEIQKVTTDEEGKYEFTGLDVGEYIVGVKAEENETGYSLPGTEVTEDTTNKFTVDDEFSTNAYSELIALAADSIMADISCGMVQAAEQTDNSEEVDSNNAVNDDAIDNTESEDSINNDDGQETVQTDNTEETAVTENELDADTEQSLDYSVSLSDLETETDPNSISGMLWLDENTNGIYDEDEQPASDYPVYLYKSDNTSTAIETVTTDSEGKYKFANVAAGDYKVGIKMQENGTSYLLPLCGVTNDNKFVIDWVSLEEAFTEIITMEQDSIVIGINGGLRTTAGASLMNLTDGYVLRGNSSTGTIIGTYESLYAACNELNSHTSYTTFYIMVQGDDTAIGTTATITAGKTVYLRSQSVSSRFTLTQTYSTRHIKVYGTLYMQYITLDGGGVGGGIYVYSGGTLNMSTSSVIQNCYAIYYGGGIYMDSGTLNMTASSCYVRDCVVGDGAYGNGAGIYAIGTSIITMTSGHVEGNKLDAATASVGQNNGGGIYLGGASVASMNSSTCYIQKNEAFRGAGVFVDNTTFNMNGGYIGGTSSTNTSNGNIGSGVFINGDNAIFNMGSSDGTYTTATYIQNSSGVGVFLSSGEFNMNRTNCYIRYNDGNSNGGGIYVYGSAATANMNAGTISHNSAVKGGGVSVNYGTFNMGGSGECHITYNKATSYGGGVELLHGSFNMGNGTNYCYINNNTAETRGGGVYLGAPAYSLTDPTVRIPTFDMITTYCYISGNNVTSGSGGGVCVLVGEFNMKAGTIGGSSADENSATNGGGVYMYSVSDTFYAVFTMGGSGACNITYNKATTSGGGVYVNGTYATFDMSTTSCYIRSNTAETNGGGVSLVNGVFNMKSGDIGGSGSENTAANGGGVYASGGTFTMGGTNLCQIWYNTASANGGGVFVSGAIFNMNTSNSYIRSRWLNKTCRKGKSCTSSF